LTAGLNITTLPYSGVPLYTTARAIGTEKGEKLPLVYHKADIIHRRCFCALVLFNQIFPSFLPKIEFSNLLITKNNRIITDIKEPPFPFETLENGQEKKIS